MQYRLAHAQRHSRCCARPPARSGASWPTWRRRPRHLRPPALRPKILIQRTGFAPLSVYNHSPKITPPGSRLPPPCGPDLEAPNTPRTTPRSCTQDRGKCLASPPPFLYRSCTWCIVPPSHDWRAAGAGRRALAPRPAHRRHGIPPVSRGCIGTRLAAMMVLAATVMPRWRPWVSGDWRSPTKACARCTKSA